MGKNAKNNFTNIKELNNFASNDFKNLSGFKEAFCLKTVIWYYLNRLERLYVVNTKGFKTVGFSSGVKTVLSGGQYKITEGTRVMAENDDIFIPALWINNASIIAYSKNGYNGRSWTLPGEWSGVMSVKLYNISDKGREARGVIKVNSGNITLSVAKDEMILIEKND